MRRALAVTLAILATGCTVARRMAGTPRGMCEYVVYNRTSYALDVRAMRDTTGRVVAASIGTINPHERISDTAPCSAGAVWIRGYALPLTVGWPASFSFVDGWTDLAPGVKSSVSLHYP